MEERELTGEQRVGEEAGEPHSSCLEPALEKAGRSRQGREGLEGAGEEVRGGLGVRAY